MLVMFLIILRVLWGVVSGEVVAAGVSQSVSSLPACSEAKIVDGLAIHKQSCLSGSDSLVLHCPFKRSVFLFILVKDEAYTHFDYYGSYHLNFKCQRLT